MAKLAKLISCIAIGVALAFTLGACGGSNSASSASSNADSQASSASADDTETREEVKQLFDKAAEATFTSVTYNVETKTSATNTNSVNGQTQQQTMTTTMKGEINKDSESPSMHMNYVATSSQSPDRTEYDMYITPTERIVRQGEDLYLDQMTADDLENYMKSITSVTSPEEIEKLLELASECSIEKKDGETVVSLTLDRDKLNESDLIDSSALPEGTEIATLVASFSFDDQNRIMAARLMSSTAGSPTYRVAQTYKFSNYDTTTMPEWPDLDAYIAALNGT